MKRFCRYIYLCLVLRAAAALLAPAPLGNQVDVGTHNTSYKVSPLDDRHYIMLYPDISTPPIQKE